MNQKLSLLRASPKPSLAKTLGISLESHNGCTIASPNRIQTRFSLFGQDYTAGQRAIIETRFWAKVNKTQSCWLWTASVTGSGSVNHGQFKFPRLGGAQHHMYAHRLSWELAYGAIPDGLQVCHTCDVARCVRPEHLFLGTQDDNLKDAARKGRFHTPRTRALSQADRLAIYHMPNRRGLGIELALRYRVSKACICRIRQGRFIGAPLSRAVA